MSSDNQLESRPATTTTAIHSPRTSVSFPSPREYDLLIVGGGISGLSLAVHAARRGLRTALIESGTLGGYSTQRTCALVHTKYSEPRLARLALSGLEQFEHFSEIYGGSAGFRPAGLLWLPSPDGAGGRETDEHVGMLRSLGVDVEVVNADRAREIDSCLDLSDARSIGYEPRSGYADPSTTTKTLVGAASAAGVELRAFTDASSLLVTDRGEVAGVILSDGSSIAAGTTFLCAGDKSRSLAATANLELPLRRSVSKLAQLKFTAVCHTAVLDAPGNVYFRPDRDRMLVGRLAWTGETPASMEHSSPHTDTAFVESVRGRLLSLMPSARATPYSRISSGTLDMTPDGLPLLGPAKVDGLWVCCGWSGMGFKAAPAAGEMLADWLATGQAHDVIEAFMPNRW